MARVCEVCGKKTIFGLVLVAAVLCVTALAIAGYVIQARSRPEAIGLTTETAALSVCLLGAACGAGHPELALVGGIVVSAILAYKEPLHGLVAKLAPDDISAGVKLLAASFIVLPLLPTEPLDPWGALVPRSLWLLVILIAGLSLVGYVATRALGPERGTAVTGLSGGLVSSTAVTLTFATRAARSAEPATTPSRPARSSPGASRSCAWWCSRRWSTRRWWHRSSARSEPWRSCP